MIHFILTRILRLRYYAIHSVNAHGHGLKTYVYSFDKPNISSDKVEMYDWTNF